MRGFFLFVCFHFLINSLFAQNIQDSLIRKNTVKLDLTNHLLYKNVRLFSFERVLNPRQSFVLSAGYIEFPNIVNLGEKIISDKIESKSGYKFGLEYRFYLRKENKYSAPRGIYIGPYFSSLGFKTDRTIKYQVENGEANSLLLSRTNINNLGAQLGYQFVFNDRFVIDLVFFGPSFSNYNFKTNLQGDLSFNPNDIQKKALEALLEKFPMLDDLLDTKELNSNGNFDSWAFGFRYQLHVGYRFGKYKSLRTKKPN
ncbi:MAG: hypothetical protein HWE15_03805 [Algoriphagus sp.]|uniref:hypothetical protein n=1 Tax=Algoriphagus sp. TaxID=1872435 RepID=UPI0017C26034|nr:hypothetical protein [Algoriphagus sp.]NVJ85402.1 hypothetical protein [Algoriphagus sp.]